MDAFEARRADAFFSHVIGRYPPSREVAIVCVAHMVPNAVLFLGAVSRIGTLKLVLPKPKSIDRPEFAIITEDQKRPWYPLSRTWSSDASVVVETLSSFGIVKEDLIIADIGGYFARSINELADEYQGKLLGVMEGTENGVQKYENSDMFEMTGSRVPILTVARSPLKLPEDYLVGSSIVFSVEAILRDLGQILQTRTACVVGYGRVGEAVASILRGRGISTVVHDTDPVALAKAAAQGYQAFRRLDNALAVSTLVVAATGNRSLDKYGFGALKSGSVVATVTSADDEIDVSALDSYNKVQVSPGIARYDEGGSKYFWLVNDGNAANFLHGAVIGPAIQLIEGEKLAAISRLTHTALDPGLAELPASTRRGVAEIWNEHFLFD